MPRDDFDEFERFLANERGDRKHPSRFWKRGPKLSPAALFVVLMIASTVVLGVLLFNQTLNAPTTTAQAVLSKLCDPVAPFPTSVIAGSSSFVVWRCTSTTGAIHVNTAGTVTPTITKGSEWTTTYLIGNGSTFPTTSCASAGGPSKAVLSGTAVTFASTDIGDWYYCSDFVNAPSFMSAVTYSWSQ